MKPTLLLCALGVGILSIAGDAFHLGKRADTSGRNGGFPNVVEFGLRGVLLDEGGDFVSVVFPRECDLGVGRFGTMRAPSSERTEDKTGNGSLHGAGVICGFYATPAFVSTKRA